MIEFDTVTKVYPDGTTAIEDISFTVEEGTTTVLVGPSGCGKTTTMRLVNRLEEPTEGAVYFDGEDTSSVDEIELRRNIGYVIQEIGLFDHMTVGENIATVPELKGWDEARIDDRIDELLELMALPREFRDQYPTELSGGQRQRVGVARALAADPDVLLMDEPFGALDPITRDDLQDEFLAIQDRINTTIIFVTHSINEALKMGDKIAIFDVGEIVQYDTPHEILANPATEFVADFIGENRLLKQLSITPVSEVMEPVEAHADRLNDVDGTAAAADGGERLSDPPSPSTDLRSAFITLLEADRSTSPVVADGEVVGVITESGIRSHFRDGTEGA